MPSRMRNITRVNKGVLVGLYEISGMAGVSRQRAGHIVREEWFPEPFEFMKMGTCWARIQVEKALKEKGYPKKQPRRPLRGVTAEE